MMRFCLAILCLFSSVSWAQISTEIDTAHIKIGEPIQYEISVLINSKDEIQLPEIKDTLSFHIEVLEHKIDTVFEGEKQKLVQQISLTSFDPGEFLIRSLPVIINNDTLLTKSFQILVDEVEIDSANLGGFPIKPIMHEELTWKDYWDKYWLYFVIGGLIFIVLLVILILFFRNNKFNKVKTFEVKTPYEEAKEALKNLDKKKLIEKGSVANFYAELSFILRRYVGRIYHFSSLELLSDDLIKYFRQSTHLEKEEIEKLKQFLMDSDLAKFAKVIPENEKHEFYRNWIENFVDENKPMDLPQENLPEIKPNEKPRVIK